MDKIDREDPFVWDKKEISGYGKKNKALKKYKEIQLTTYML